MSPSASPSDASGPKPGGRKARWFRLFAFLLPVCLLGTLEAILRLGGNHTPTAFWIPGEAPDEVIPNPRFAERFVGPTQARMPRSVRVQEHPADQRLRIIIFGESAALGDPEPAFGMSRCLEALLENRLAGRPVEVVNTSITALNSFAFREAARDSRRLRADFWVIYAGNNEVVGPFGPASISGGSRPGLATTRLGLRFRETALGQWFTKQQSTQGEGLSLAQRWVGMEQFLDRQVSWDDPRLPGMRENFRANLHDVIELGLGAGAQIVLSTMAVNLLDCPPFGSVSTRSTNTPIFPQWAAAATNARAEDDRGAVTKAVAAWTNAATLWPEDAETRYRLGLARLNAGDLSTGRADLELARDLDTLRFRADSKINQVTRDLAREFTSRPVRFVDADRELRGTDPERPPGADLFLEHVHLRPEGNYRLARLMAEQIGAALGLPSTTTNWLDMQPCLERLGWNPFAESRLWTQTQALCERPPFSQQSNAELRRRYLDDRLTEANRLARPAALTNALARVQAMVNRHPDDWQLREQLARLLQTGRRWAQAGTEWRQIVGRAPGYVVGWYQLGESLSAAGDKSGAQQAYEKALRIRPDFFEASLGLGLVLGETKNFAAAVQALDQALKLSPRSLQARVNRGVSLIGLGRFDEAIRDFRQGATEHPTVTMPLLRLGELLSNQKSFAAAAAAYGEASRRETNNVALRHRYAVELSRAALTNESVVEFRRVIEQVPTSAIARLDLGVALAQQARFQEAIPEFEAALKLQPTNAQALAYLQQIRTKLGQNGVR